MESTNLGQARSGRADAPTEERPPTAPARTRLRHLLTALAVVGLPFLVAAVLARRLPPEGEAASVTLENFHRIKLGMSRPAVEAVLGVPPENPARAYRYVYCDGT